MVQGYGNMKKKPVIIMVVLLMTLVIFFYRKTDEDVTRVATVTTSKNVITNVQNAQLEEILEEKRIQRENTVEIEYINIAVEDVRIPILMYHSISDTDPSNNLLVPPEMFEEQINWLEENGFTSMLLDDVIKAMDTGKVPKKPVVITFDDGYTDNYTDAYQTLKKHNMKATFFIITNNVDKDSTYMSSDMLKEMKSNGMAIENHTSNHLELNKLSKDDQISSIKDGQDFLKNIIGVEGKFLCYPVGRYDNITIETAKELGVQAAVTTEGGISSMDNGVYKLKRVRISPMSLESFSEIFSEFIH